MESMSRKRVLVYVVLFSLGGVGLWWQTRYKPSAAALEAEAADLVQKQSRIVTSTQRMVSLGELGTEAELGRLRSEANAVSLRVPTLDPSSRFASVFADRVSSLSREHGVRVYGVPVPVASSREGVFQVDGVSVQVVGRYHDVGAFMGRILSSERIVQLRAARVDAIPDSLVRSAVSVSTVGGVEMPPAPALPDGEPPFSILFSFTAVWFSLAVSPSDSSSVGVAGALPVNSTSPPAPAF